MQQPLLADIPFEGSRSNASTALQRGNPTHHGHTGPQTGVHLVSGLISTAVYINYEKTKGRLQYFSPTSSLDRYCKEVLRLQSVLPEVGQKSKRPYKVLSEIPEEVDDYLTNLFWTHYNATKNVVGPAAYRRDRESGRSTSYSGFLHLCVLAIGFLFADQEKEELRSFSLGDGTSVFYQEAKYALDAELVDPEGLATIRAMMVLSDLECAYGKEELGWIYTGASYRLALDFGLNLDCSQLGLSEEETQIRVDLLRSCSLHDMSWALYLGRPTSIKSSDIPLSRTSDIIPSLCITTRLSLKVCHGNPASPDEILESQIRMAMLSLTKIAVKIQATAHVRCNSENQYVEVAAMADELEDWHSTLPTHLHWTPGSVRHAPPIFFVLHQQYHTNQIFLHGPGAQYEKTPGSEFDHSHVGDLPGMGAHDKYSFFQMSRAISFNSSLRVAEIFSSHRQRFGRYEASLFSVQHAGTAALTLIASIPALEYSKQMLALQNLQILKEVLQELSMIHRPVKTVFTAVDHIIKQYVEDMKTSPPPPGPGPGPMAARPAPSLAVPARFIPPASTATPRGPTNLTDLSSTSHARKKRRFTTSLDDLTTKATAPWEEALPHLRKFHSQDVSQVHDTQVPDTSFTYDGGGGGLDGYSVPAMPDIDAHFLLGTFFPDTDFNDGGNGHDLADLSSQGAPPEHGEPSDDFIFG